MAQAVRHSGKTERISLHAQQEIKGAKHSTRQNHPTRRDPLASLPPCARGADLDGVPAVVERPNGSNFVAGPDLQAFGAGQVQVILVEGVLGSVTAPQHAAAASNAAGAWRSFA